MFTKSVGRPVSLMLRDRPGLAHAGPARPAPMIAAIAIAVMHLAPRRCFAKVPMVRTPANVSLRTPLVPDLEIAVRVRRGRITLLMPARARASGALPHDPRARQPN